MAPGKVTVAAACVTTLTAAASVTAVMAPMAQVQTLNLGRRACPRPCGQEAAEPGLGLDSERPRDALTVARKACAAALARSVDTALCVLGFSTCHELWGTFRHIPNLVKLMKTLLWVSPSEPGNGPGIKGLR